MDVIVTNNTGDYASFWDLKGKEEFIDQWFLMSSPVPVFTIILLYLGFILKLGPNYMKNRKPFKLANLLLVYNAAQVVVSTYLTILGISILAPQGLLHTTCKLDRESTTPVATGIYYYFIAKTSELLDTVFFVLRKKDNQVTFLHVYHHTIMMLNSWFTLKYEPVYATCFLGTVNSFIHVIMYSYYALSTFPQLKKYLWWKKYITSMQLIQFLAIIIHAAVNYAFSGCPPSYLLLSAIVLNSSLFIYLFSDFYTKTYFQNENKNERKKSLVKKITNGKSRKLLTKNL